MSLSIYKNSSEGYKFLFTTFALPSKNILTNLLYRVLFEAGINLHIIQNLKYQDKKLKFLVARITAAFYQTARCTEPVSVPRRHQNCFHIPKEKLAWTHPIINLNTNFYTCLHCDLIFFPFLFTIHILCVIIYNKYFLY